MAAAAASAVSKASERISMAFRRNMDRAFRGTKPPDGDLAIGWAVGCSQHRMAIRTLRKALNSKPVRRAILLDGAIKETKKLPPNSEAMLRYANNFWNNNRKVHYIKDKGDEWKPTWKMEADGGGDCEDYAIAKYNTLVGAGWDKDRLAILLTKGAGGDHAVLLAQTEEGKTYVLDIMNRDTRTAQGQTMYPFDGRMSVGRPWWALSDRDCIAYVPARRQTDVPAPDGRKAPLEKSAANGRKANAGRKASAGKGKRNTARLYGIPSDAQFASAFASVFAGQGAGASQEQEAASAAPC